MIESLHLERKRTLFPGLQGSRSSLKIVPLLMTVGKAMGQISWQRSLRKMTMRPIMWPHGMETVMHCEAWVQSLAPPNEIWFHLGDQDMAQWYISCTPSDMGLKDKEIHISCHLPLRFWHLNTSTHSPSPQPIHFRTPPPFMRDPGL